MQTKKVCELKTIGNASDVYYACDGKDFQRFYRRGLSSEKHSSSVA